MRFQRHLFVCENRRPDDHPRGCCAGRGGVQLREAFKSEVRRRGLQDKVRVNSAGCLDACEHGPTLVVYPEGIWYGGVSLEDVPEIVERHLLGGEPVDRLRIRDWDPTPAGGADPLT